ncbi:MAG: T9SS type A sorting domain-containing protein [Bacteroidota bacterium]
MDLKVFVKVGFFLSFVLVVAEATFSQDTIDFNLNFEHRVNGYSEFDRSRHIIFHEDLNANEWDSDQQKVGLFQELDMYFGRNNGTIVWEYNNTREDPNKPGWPDLDFMQTRADNFIDRHASEVEIHPLESRYANMMVGGQESLYPVGQETRIGGLVYESYEATAEYYANYLAKFFGEGGSTGLPKPRFVEVMNEPFVKADDLGTTRENIADLHNIVALRIKELNPEVKVGGYSAAFPMFEAGDFNHWNNNWKMFIDRAGENMDFFSFHLYDNAPNGVDRLEDMTYRSGSNIQAIMDMINHYSVIRLGKTLPWSISEYGFLCSGCENNSPYQEREDWYNLRSFNSMFMQILERQDQVVHSIPFMLLKANWAKPEGAEFNGYPSRLMRELGELQGETKTGEYIFTHLLKFWQFWAELKGKRLESWTIDPDIQTDAYVDGSNLFLLVNSLEFEDRELVLTINGLDQSNISKITVKELYGDVNDLPILDTLEYTEPIDRITVRKEATVLIKYELNSPLEVTESVDERSYFASTYFQPITRNEPVSFTISNVELVEHGEAILRVGLGRDHDNSLSPLLTVNGTRVDFPTDWRGFDQKTRDRFFGVIEVQVPYELLEATNQIRLTFPDDSGHISSMALQVFNFSSEIERSNQVPDLPLSTVALESTRIYPNPTFDYVTIDNFNADKVTYALVDISGKTILSDQKLNADRKINLSDFPVGIYTLVLTDSEATTITRKIIKK